MRYVVAPVRSRSLSPAPILDVLVQLHRRARQGRQPEIPFDGVVGEGSESCYLGSRRYTNGSAARCVKKGHATGSNLVGFVWAEASWT